MANSITANSLAGTSAFTSPAFSSPSASRASTQLYQRNLVTRLIGKLIAQRQRQADAEIVRYLASTGGKFTDQVEREIQRRLM